jgi:nucleoside-diphosphate-sugar epimerase
MLRVCVTGANGYIASHLVQQLLSAKKFTVVGTVRDVTDEKKTRHLLNLEGAAERLELVKADLLDDKSFAPAFADCVCVFHTASPFYVALDGTPDALSGQIYDEDSLLHPAIDGTNAVLAAAADAKVRSVVLTSSTAAIYCDTGLPSTHTFTEADWSGDALLREHRAWYALSKTLAERAAWKFVDATTPAPFKLTVINPTLVWGPALQPTLNTSCASLLGMINGSKAEHAASPEGKATIDVRDLAEAHICAFDAHEAADSAQKGAKPDVTVAAPSATETAAGGEMDVNRIAAGRVLMIAASPSWRDMCAELRVVLKNELGLDDAAIAKAVPSTEAALTPVDPQPTVPTVVAYNCAKAEALLGKKMIDWRVTLRDTVKSLAEHGHFVKE